jgi:hypothetical protein
VREGGRCEVYGRSAAPSPHPPHTQGSCFDHHASRTLCSSVPIVPNVRNQWVEIGFAPRDRDPHELYGPAALFHIFRVEHRRPQQQSHVSPQRRIRGALGPTEPMGWPGAFDASRFRNARPLTPSSPGVPSHVDLIRTTGLSRHVTRYRILSVWLWTNYWGIVGPIRARFEAYRGYPRAGTGSVCQEHGHNHTNTTHLPPLQGSNNKSTMILFTS